MKIDQIFANQKHYFNSNATKGVSFRIEQLKRFKKLIKDNESLLYEAIYNDFGKSEFEAYTSELALLYHEINVCLKNIRRWSKKIKVSTGLANFPAKSYIIPEPLGVTLVIGAWNYPFQLSLVPAITSLAAGNTVILKPSELPSRSSKVMEKLINENFPQEYFCVVEGGVEETTELLKLPFDKIFFTGSIPVGKIVYKAAAKNLTPVTLELGGKSPTFVLADADIKMSAKRIVWSKFFNAGQTCVAPDYILVDKVIEHQLLDAIKEEIKSHYPDIDKLRSNYTRIINDKNFGRLTNLIDHAKLFYGGETNQDERLISPTVLNGVTFADEIMQDEIFGPILPVLSFTDLDVVINEVKNRPKPLSCYIYSKDQNTIDKLLKEISFGGGCVNDSLMHLTNSELPFGGVGFSGFGSYHGKSGFDAFTHYKSILHKPFWFEANFKYAPYSSFKQKVIKLLFE